MIANAEDVKQNPEEVEKTSVDSVKDSHVENDQKEKGDQ